MKLLKNPLIRLIGIVAILYIGLFSNTYQKDSLGNRLSTSQIKKNLSEVKDKSFNIITNVKKARDYSSNSDSSLIIKEVKIGQGSGVVCGDLVSISYRLLANNYPITKSKNQQVTIGKKEFNYIIENNLVGLKVGGQRLLNIPDNYKIQDQALTQELSPLRTKAGLSYEIDLLTIEKPQNSDPSALQCNFEKNPK
jgi:hypothetical protein